MPTSNSTCFVNAQSPLPSSTAASLTVIVILSSSLVPALIVTAIMRRRMVSAQLCGKLHDLLWRRDHPEETTRQWQLLPVDPLGSKRSELADIAMDLSAVALRLDAHQARGFAPHPIATLLRGSHRAIQQFLRSKNSLDESTPSSLREILTTVAIVLSVPRDISVYHQLDKQVAAFDQHDDPAVELIIRPPSRLAVFADRATSSIQRISAVTVSIATFIAVLLAVILALLDKISLAALMGQLK